MIKTTSLLTALIFINADETSIGDKHHTFFIVHGATGGGWDWKEVDQLLSTMGHTVYRPTLTGLGEKYHLANPDIVNN